MVSTLRHWIEVHVTEPIDRMYEHVDHDLALDPEVAARIIDDPTRPYDRSVASPAQHGRAA